MCQSVYTTSPLPHTFNISNCSYDISLPQTLNIPNCLYDITPTLDTDVPNYLYDITPPPDTECANLFEALVGTLRAAKKRGVVSFPGQMLLSPTHDDVDVKILTA